MGNAVRLDGQNGTQISLGTPIHPGNSVSVEAWFNLDTDATNIFSAIIARWDGSYELDIDNNTFDPLLGNGRAGMVVRNTTNTLAYGVTNTPVTRGQWHHIVGIFNGVSDGGSGSVTVYVDGIQGTTNTIGGDLRNAGGDDGLWYIGRTRSPNSGFAWDGLLDEVAVYNYALTPQQIGRHIAAASQTSSSTIPEPSSTLGLIALGVLGLGTTLKRKL